MNLTAANTAIVLDSTADFPEGPERFPNWRIVPLYVNFGEESYRDYVDLGPDEFYARLADASEPPTTSQPTPGDFLAVYEELAGAYERIYSLQLSSTLSGTFASAEAAAATAGEAVRVVDTRTVSAAVAMLALAVQRRLERGTTDEEIDALVERYRDRSRPALHRRHARVPRARRPDRPRRRLRRDAAEREADPRDRGRRGRAAQARAREPEGARGARGALVAARRPTSRRCGSGSRTRRRRSGSRRSSRSSARRGRRRPSRSSPALGAVVGTHAGPGHTRALLVRRRR